MKKTIRIFCTVSLFVFAFLLGYCRNISEKDAALSSRETDIHLLKKEIAEARFMLKVKKQECWYLIDYGEISSEPGGKGIKLVFDTPYSLLPRSYDWFSSFRTKHAGKQVLFYPKGEVSRRRKVWPIFSGQYVFCLQ